MTPPKAPPGTNIRTPQNPLESANLIAVGFSQIFQGGKG